MFLTTMHTIFLYHADVLCVKVIYMNRLSMKLFCLWSFSCINNNCDSFPWHPVVIYMVMTTVTLVKWYIHPTFDAHYF